MRAIYLTERAEMVHCAKERRWRSVICSCIAALCLLNAVALASTGKIRICRKPHVVGARDRLTTIIPAGAVFLTPDGAARVHTTTAASIGPKPRCATASAVIDLNRTGHRLHRGFRLSWTQFVMAGLDLEATVLTPI